MKKYGNEFKIGLFFTLCLLGLMYLIVSTGKLNIKQGGYYIYVAFDEVAGVEGPDSRSRRVGLPHAKVERVPIVHLNHSGFDQDLRDGLVEEVHRLLERFQPVCTARNQEQIVDDRG